MPSMKVDVFKANFDGASRPNRYAVAGEIGQEGSLNNILVRAASMPSSTVGIIRVPFRGRIVKIPGDRTYEEWTFTMYDAFEGSGQGPAGTIEHRNRFLKWSQNMNEHDQNIPTGSWASNSGSIDLLDPSTFTEFQVHQLDLVGNSRRVVSLFNCWPTVVSELTLNYDSSDALAEFSVTLAYDHMEEDPNTSQMII